MLGSRGMVVLGAMVLAGLAFFVLMRGGGEDGRRELRRAGAVPSATSTGSAARTGASAARVREDFESGPDTRGPKNAPALDHIEAESRARMRELLREAGQE
ncbi:MAG: hypothetical protein AB8G23_08675 [Myxococcota bacterium]